MALEITHSVGRAETIDFIFESLCDDIKISWESYIANITDMCEQKLLECLASSDGLTMYKAYAGITWSTFTKIMDPIHRSILLKLIENPKCFFVLFNTQKGKLRISGKEMATWSMDTKMRAVSFLIVDNDRTLSEQSVNGLFGCFPTRLGQENAEESPEKYNVQIYELSSNNKTSLREILLYIDAYAFNLSYAMPLIVVLANNKQIEKLIRILLHIKSHACEKLCAGVVWDEGDKTYPMFRDKNFVINGTPVNYLQFVNESDDRTIFRTGFVTATEGELIEEEYEECVNAYHYPVVIDSVDKENYFAFHHPECEKKHVSVYASESNNTIAKRILRDNKIHFTTPFILDNGDTYQHKIIINSNASTNSMIELAKELRSEFNVLTFNMNGVTLFTNDGPDGGKKYSARKQNFNRLLFYIYKMNHLENKPLIIMGRRKVDRGLGFHYAPRSYGRRTLLLEGKDGHCHTDGVEGLIWTDMIIGNRIVDIPVAVQKAGRGAGIIRQCPQYPKKFTYWVDTDTSQAIERHYKKVDKVNELCGSNTIRQAIQQADASLSHVRRNHSVDLNTFRVIRGITSDNTMEITKQIIERVFNETFRKPRCDRVSGKYITSLNKRSEVANLLDAIQKVPGAYGTLPGRPGEKIYRRFFPCYNGNTLYCIIPCIDPKYTDDMKRQLDESYSNYLITIPQEGDFPE